MVAAWTAERMEQRLRKAVMVKGGAMRLVKALAGTGSSRIMAEMEVKVSRWVGMQVELGAEMVVATVEAVVVVTRKGRNMVDARNGAISTRSKKKMDCVARVVRQDGKADRRCRSTWHSTRTTRRVILPSLVVE